jgi:DTW domain-containing protein
MKTKSVSTTQNTFIHQFAPKYEGRCATCYMRQEKCICELIPKIENKIPLTVIMHFKESYKTTNTARLAGLCLKNSEIILRGLPQQPIQFDQIVKEDEELFFLTLNPACETLTPELAASIKKPIRLVVPDGTWSQASRIGKREPALAKARWVQLPPGPPSKYKLRHEHLEEGLSTLEAIARAYGIIESPQIQSQLETIFDIMVERTLETRPKNRNEIQAKYR